jgi:ferric-dicitrate binding protein FerR (iron transport regulator)
VSDDLPAFRLSAPVSSPGTPSGPNDAARREAPPDSVEALLERYLTDGLAPEEAERFERWLEERSERRAVVGALRGVGTDIDGRTVLNGPVDVRAWWAEFSPTLTNGRSGRDGAAAKAMTARRPRRAPMRLSPPLFGFNARAAVAAAVIVLALGGLRLVVGAGGAARGVGASVMRSYRTARGERAIVTLDGARVTLGPESELRVPADYGEHERNVGLVGHAFFDVVHDAARPFRVRAGRAMTEDLGTRFDIEAYEGAAATRVVVMQGEVSIRPAAAVPRRGGGGRAPPAVTVRAGTLASADSAGLVRVEATSAADRYVAWSEGRLTFTDTPLPTVLAELGRWYDIDLRIGDERLRGKSFTASFVGDPIADVLHTLERTLAVRAVRDGRTVTLYTAGYPGVTR